MPRGPHSLLLSTIPALAALRGRDRLSFSSDPVVAVVVAIEGRGLRLKTEAERAFHSSC
jgi:hypothetical protein